jgi:hypothetical protein
MLVFLFAFVFFPFLTVAQDHRFGLEAILEEPTGVSFKTG